MPGLRRLRRACRRSTARSPPIGRPPHEIAFVSGIGCSSRIPGYTTAYGFNSVHGRALPIAQGIKLAQSRAAGAGRGRRRRRLLDRRRARRRTPIRRNIDLTYIVMDNQIYGLTKGQLSPTSPRGLRTASSSWGSLEDPVNPLLYVLGYGARFVAQGTPADMAGLAAVIEEAIRFPGFAFVNVQSPCVTYGAGGAAAQGAQGRHAAAREPRPRPGRPPAGDGARAGVRRRSSTPASSTATPSRRRPTRPRRGRASWRRARRHRPRHEILEMFRAQ